MPVGRASALLLLAACGGPLSGDWAGTWTSTTGASGALSATLRTDRDDTITGSFTFDDSPCFSAAEVVGVLVDDVASGSATAGSIRVDFDATLVDDALNGTYYVFSGGFCTGDRGTFSIQR